MEDEPIKTVHLYVVREGDTRPSLIPVIISLCALSLLVAIGVLAPYQQPEQRASIRVPAVPLFTKAFSTPITVVPTGVKTYPATYASGTLTLTNGSIIAQVLPKGFIVTANIGVEAATDAAVFVPAGSANGYSMTTVSAHLLSAGVNLSTLSINQVIGTSLYIRNLQPFSGGHPAYSVKFATAQDKAMALKQARQRLASEIEGLHYPCRETVTTLLSWRCQFVTYSVPSYMHVVSVQLQGKEVVVTVWFVAHPTRIWVK
ncbi:MAG TPA: hypothetical protein VKR83_02060 [Ktedonobacteraceae bacterium]|nr:hypothetical protein [Ktedonobacteraceae bacterium]